MMNVIIGFFYLHKQCIYSESYYAKLFHKLITAQTGKNFKQQYSTISKCISTNSKEILKTAANSHRF